MSGYLPGSDAAWERREPRAAGLDPLVLADAVRFAETNETGWERDIDKVLEKGNFEPPPWNAVIGPTRPRGGPNGLILRGGRIVAEWGDTARADMTFSVTKSYLSTCAGLAVDDGLIADLDAPVAATVDDGGFEGPHNSRITWRQLLQQTSEWEGTLWDKPDQIDRNRDLSREGRAKEKGQARPLREPGTYWEYNDIRVNRLSLAVLRRVGRPLPELLRERIMGPIGASPDWEWHGYRNSWVEVGGRQMQSVSGGGHWGGGLFIGSRDHARFGLLMLNRGRWDGRQLVSTAWIDAALAPCPINPGYGFMWWLNADRQRHPAAPARGFAASGAGSSIIWIDPENDLVAVVRWIDKDAVDGFVSRLTAAVRS